MNSLLWRRTNTAKNFNLKKNFTWLLRAVTAHRGTKNLSVTAYCGTIQNKTGSSQVGAISKAQKYSKNNYWKLLEKLCFSKKNFENFFFEKKYFFRKSHNAEKLKKRPFRLIKRFYKPKTSKNARGYPLIESENFRKKVA